MSNPEDARRIGNDADGSVQLFAIRRGGPRGDGRRPPFGPPPEGAGRWVLVAQSQAGSLEALVARTRYRNIAISGVILLLLLVAVALLTRFSRQAHRLADLQMNFVAGVFA